MDTRLCSLHGLAGPESLPDEFVLLVRHGESEYNRTPLPLRLFAMRRDAPLSLRAVAEAKSAADAVSGKILPDIVIVSPLKRARQFGQIVFGSFWGKIEISPLHAEWRVAPVDVPISFYRAESRTVSTLYHNVRIARGVKWRGHSGEELLFRMVRFVQAVVMWRMGARVETRGELEKRVRLFAEDILRRNARRIVVVGHGRFFAQLLAGRHLENGEVAILTKDDLGRLLQETRSRQIA